LGSTPTAPCIRFKRFKQQQFDDIMKKSKNREKQKGTNSKILIIGIDLMCLVCFKPKTDTATY